MVRAEGTAEIVEDAPPATEVTEYVEKYRDAIARIGFDPDGSRAGILRGDPGDAHALASLVVRVLGP